MSSSKGRPPPSSLWRQPSLLANPSLQEVHERRAGTDQRVEQVEQHLAFLSLAAGITHIERRTGREADEVQLAAGEAGLAFMGRQLRRQHREAGRERERPFVRAANLELGQVGAGDAPVAADVDDVDPRNVVPQAIDCAGNDAAGHQRLAETYLVGHEKAAGAVFRPKQPVESVIHRAALKRLERLETRVDGGSLHGCGFCASASSTAVQISNRSSGTILRPSSVFRRSSISRSGPLRDDGRCNRRRVRTIWLRRFGEENIRNGFAVFRQGLVRSPRKFRDRPSPVI